MAVARVTEIICGSPQGLEEAITSGLARADSTLENIESAWVKDIKVAVKDGKVFEWRVNMKVTFILKD